MMRWLSDLLLGAECELNLFLYLVEKNYTEFFSGEVDFVATVAACSAYTLAVITRKKSFFSLFFSIPLHMHSSAKVRDDKQCKH